MLVNFQTIMKDADEKGYAVPAFNVYNMETVMGIIKAAEEKRAIDESPIMSQYDYIVLNDEVENCVDKIHELVDAAKHSTDRNREFIEMMKKELAELK